MVQWLRLHAPNTGDPGLIPGQGTRSHMPQLRVCMLQLKIPHAAIEIQDVAYCTQLTCCNRVNKYENKQRQKFYIPKHTKRPLSMGKELR